MATKCHDKIFIDENRHYQIDFSSADWVCTDLNDSYKCTNTLCDVDVIVRYINQQEEKTLLLEYKNGNIENASVAFDPHKEVKIRSIARKYYDSLIYLLASNAGTNYYYVYICEYEHSDTTTNLLLQNKIASLLPFMLQKNPDIKTKLINKFEVLTIDEWNSNPEYSQFPITQI